MSSGQNITKVDQFFKVERKRGSLLKNF